MPATLAESPLRWKFLSLSMFRQILTKAVLSMRRILQFSLAEAAQVLEAQVLEEQVVVPPLE